MILVLPSIPHSPFSLFPPHLQLPNSHNFINSGLLPNLQAALDLLEDLMSHDSANFREGISLIRQIHLVPTILKDDQLDFAPVVAARSERGYPIHRSYNS